MSGEQELYCRRNVDILFYFISRIKQGPPKVFHEKVCELLMHPRRKHSAPIQDVEDKVKIIKDLNQGSLHPNEVPYPSGNRAHLFVLAQLICILKSKGIPT